MTSLIITRSSWHMGFVISNAIVFGTKTDIWTLRCIGTGIFQRGVRDSHTSSYVFNVV